MIELEKEKTIADCSCDNVVCNETKIHYTNYDTSFNVKTVCNGHMILTSKMLDKSGIQKGKATVKAYLTTKPKIFTICNITVK